MTIYDDLVSVIGLDSTLQLMSKFGGVSLLVPNAKGRGEGAQIFEAIMKLHNQEVDLIVIAGEFKLEVNTVIDVLESSLTFEST